MVKIVTPVNRHPLFQKRCTQILKLTSVQVYCALSVPFPYETGFCMFAHWVRACGLLRNFI